MMRSALLLLALAALLGAGPPSPNTSGSPSLGIDSSVGGGTSGSTPAQFTFVTALSSTAGGASPIDAVISVQVDHDGSFGQAVYGLDCNNGTTATASPVSLGEATTPTRRVYTFEGHCIYENPGTYTPGVSVVNPATAAVIGTDTVTITVTAQLQITSFFSSATNCISGVCLPTFGVTTTGTTIPINVCNMDCDNDGAYDDGALGTIVDHDATGTCGDSGQTDANGIFDGAAGVKVVGVECEDTSTDTASLSINLSAQSVTASVTVAPTTGATTDTYLVTANFIPNTTAAYPVVLDFDCLSGTGSDHNIQIDSSDVTSYTFGTDGGAGCGGYSEGQHTVSVIVQPAGLAADVTVETNISVQDDADPTFAHAVTADPVSGDLVFDFTGTAAGPTEIHADCDRNESQVGANVGVWWATDTTFPYCDRMKSSTWDAGGGGWGLQNGAQVTYDANGYIATLVDTDGGTAATARVFLNREIHRLNDTVDDPNGYYPTGNYTVACTGAGEIKVGFDAAATTINCPDAGTVVAVTPTSAGISVEVTVAPVEGVTVTGPAADTCTIDSDWRDIYLLGFIPFNGPIRFMDWSAVNKQDGTAITDVTRTKTTQRTWTQTDAPSPQVPWEVQIDLANAVDNDPWFTIPDQATDAYVTELAEAACGLTASLDAALVPIFELSNEVWNDSFTQKARLNAEGIAAAYPGVTEAFWWYRQIERTQQIRTLVATQCDAATRPFRIALGMQNADPVRTTPTQSFGAWVSPEGETIATTLSTLGVDGQPEGFVAIAPYFEWADENGTRISPATNYLTMASWTPDQHHQAMLNDIELGSLFTNTQSHVDNLNGLGIPIWFYEWGSHWSCVGACDSHQPWIDSAWAAHRDHGIDNVVRRFLQKARSIVGNTPMAMYLFGGPATKWNQWGFYEFDFAGGPLPDNTSVIDAPKFLGAAYEFHDTVSSSESTITLAGLCGPVWEEGAAYTLCTDAEREGVTSSEVCQQVGVDPDPQPTFTVTPTSFSNLTFDSSGNPTSYRTRSTIQNVGTASGTYTPSDNATWVTPEPEHTALSPGQQTDVVWVVTTPGTGAGNYTATGNIANDQVGTSQDVTFDVRVETPASLGVALDISPLTGLTGQYSADTLEVDLTGSVAGFTICGLACDCPATPCDMTTFAQAVAGTNTVSFPLDTCAATWNAAAATYDPWVMCFRAAYSNDDAAAVVISDPVPDLTVTTPALQATAETGVADSVDVPFEVCSTGDADTTAEFSVVVTADDCTAAAAAPNDTWVTVDSALGTLAENSCQTYTLSFPASQDCDADTWDFTVTLDCTPNCDSEPITKAGQLIVSGTVAQLYTIDFNGAGDPTDWADPIGAYAQGVNIYRMTTSPEAHAIYKGPADVAEGWSNYEACARVTAVDASSGVALTCFTNSVGGTTPTTGYRVRANNAAWEFNHFGNDLCKNADLSPALLLTAAPDDWNVCIRCDASGESANEIDAVVWKEGEARPAYDGVGAAGASAVGSCTDSGRLYSSGAPAIWSYAGGAADKDWIHFEVNNLGGGGGSPFITNSLAADPTSCVDGACSVDLTASPTASGTTVTQCDFWEDCPAQSGDTLAQATVACGGAPDGTDVAAPFEHTAVAYTPAGTYEPWSTCTDGSLSDGDGATVTVVSTAAVLTCSPAITQNVTEGAALGPQQVTCTNSGNATSTVSSAAFTGTSNEAPVGTAWAVSVSPATASIVAGGSQVFTLTFDTTGLLVGTTPATTTFRATDQVGNHDVAVRIDISSDVPITGCNVGTAPYGSATGVTYTSASGQVSFSLTFGSTYTCGKYADGTFWGLANNGSFTMQSMSPALGAGGVTNGYQTNRTPYSQGLENRGNAGDQYSAEQALPRTFTSGFPLSFVKNVSRTGVSVDAAASCEAAGNDNRSCMKYADVFTIVNAIPDSDGDQTTLDEFRPAFTGTSKAGPFRTDMMDTVLASWPYQASVGSPPSLSFCEQILRHPRLEFESRNFSDTDVPEHNYRPLLSSYNGRVQQQSLPCILRTFLTDAAVTTESPRSTGRQLLIHIVQRGIDTYGLAVGGKTWPNASVVPTGGWGGHVQGRKMYTAYAAWLLGDTAMRAHVGSTSAYWESGLAYLSNGEHYYGKTLSFGGCAGEPADNCASADNGPQRWCRPAASAGDWDGGCCPVTGQDSYIFQHMNMFTGFSLLVQFLGAQSMWNDEVIALGKKLADGGRGAGQVWDAQGDTKLYCGPTNKGAKTNFQGQGSGTGGYYNCEFCKALWDAYGIP